MQWPPSRIAILKHYYMLVLGFLRHVLVQLRPVLLQRSSGASPACHQTPLQHPFELRHEFRFVLMYSARGGHCGDSRPVTTLGARLHSPHPHTLNADAGV